ncbi:MAG: DUF359 domain-containing protein [Candidatus Hodarchaeota archaeon]
MQKLTKKELLRIQIMALIILSYAIFVVLSITFFKGYLLYEGIGILISLYIIPFITTVVIFAVFLKKTFGARMSPRKVAKSFDLPPEVDYSRKFFPPGVKALEMVPELRPTLARVHGDLIAGNEEETLPKIQEFLEITEPVFLAGCGDVISKNLLETGSRPDIIIIDGKTCREEYEMDLPIEYVLHPVKNLTGGITREAWYTIAKAIKSFVNTVIEVKEGEEDLLVIPLVLLSPIGSVISYGQPPVTDLDPPIPSGAVMIVVTPLVKDKFESILQKFKKNLGE